MQKLVRYRKAFYEKENHLQNGNKKRDFQLPVNEKNQTHDKLYRSLSQSILPKTFLTKKEKVKGNTQLYCESYGEQLLSSPCYELKSPHFLKRHQVDGLLRARMLDWMVEVTASYKFTNKTYFDGISLMDRFFESERESIAPARLHVIGVQCMLIASKMNQVYPLKIKTVYEKIGHKKLPLEQLVQTEQTIIKSLNYKLNSWTFFDIALMKIAQLVHRDEDQRQTLGELLISYNSTSKEGEKQEGKESQLKKMEDLCSYLSKFAVYDYQFYCDNSVILLAESVIKATFQILQMTTPINFFSCSPISIELCKQKLFKSIHIHKSKYQNLGNLFKFTRKDVTLKVEEFLWQ